MTKRQRAFARLFLIAAVLFLGSSAVFSQQLYDPPIWGDNLEAGERLYHFKTKHNAAGHPQEWAYDILGVRHLSGTSWSTKKANTSGNANTTYIIYNKPVYAMDGGTVVACWRNAPENSPAGATNAQVTNKRIGLGGNMVWVREDDGEMVLYAHAITGTIPAAICPNNNTLFAAPYAVNDDQMPAASLVAAANQVRIERGDYLFQAGNSGNSSEPHLHIHKISAVNGSARHLNFRRGLYTPGDTNTANLNVWLSYAGGTIPQGPLLFWPPRRLTPEFARHGFQSEGYQRLFLHLLDSGFQLAWLDTYSVGGKTFMNFVWHPGTDEWRASHLMNETDYKAYIKFDEDNHFDPVQIETSLEGGNVRYSVTSIKNKPGGWRARHLLPANEYITVRDKARSDGLVPASVAVVSIAGIRFYTVLFNHNDIGDWRIEPEIPEGGYQQVYDTQAAAGRRPIYLNAYMHNGNPFISAIFASKNGSNRISKHALSEPDYQAAYNQYRTGNRLTMTVTSFDNAQQQHRYAAVWAKP